MRSKKTIFIVVSVAILLSSVGGLVIYNIAKPKTPTLNLEELHTESKTSERSSFEAAQLVQELPIVKQLPYIEDSFRIDYGLSNDENSDATALYIRSNSEEAEQKALKWLRDNGVDTEKVEIIFNAE